MPIQNPEKIKQFLKLQSKSELELRAICEGLQVSIEGDKEQLLQNLLATDSSPQTVITKPQAIPLRSKDSFGRSITKATEALSSWRKKILRSNLSREFLLTDIKGNSFKLVMKYIRCPKPVASAILKNGWYLKLENQRDLIQVVRTRIDQFNMCIIQKPDNRGNSWLMLHVEPNINDNC